MTIFCNYFSLLLHREWLIVISPYIDMLHHVCASLTSAQISSYADIMKGIASCLCKSYISTDFIIRWHHEGYCIMFCWVQHVAFHHLASIKAWTQTISSFLDLFSSSNHWTWILCYVVLIAWSFRPNYWIHHVSHWIFSVLTTGLSSSDKCCFACFLCFKYINSIITPLVCFLLRLSYSWRNTTPNEKRHFFPSPALCNSLKPKFGSGWFLGNI